MASKKQHAAIDFQGAAKITIGGGAGDSGQVLTSGGSGAMTWDDVATGSIADGAIDTAQLASYAVNEAKIATNAILNSHISNASVTMPKLGGWKKFNVFWDNISNVLLFGSPTPFKSSAYLDSRIHFKKLL